MNREALIDGGGGAEFHFQLGLIYLSGNGVDKSTELAMKHLEIAEAKGSKAATARGKEIAKAAAAARAAAAATPLAANTGPNPGPGTSPGTGPGTGPSPNPCSFCSALGATMLCGRCKAARYCHKDCQRQHWKGAHKAGCSAAS